jgi:DNA polymerase
VIFLDFETFSEVPINYGVYNYAAQVEILICTWAIDDGVVAVWDVESGAPMPVALYEALKLGDIICAHNSSFDRNVALRTEDFSGIALGVERWYCTMVQALAHGLPGGLDKLSEIFGLNTETAKAKSGKALIKLFCIPQKDGTRIRRADKPTESKAFDDYAIKDVLAMRAVHKLLPQTNFPVDPTHVERQAWFRH